MNDDPAGAEPTNDRLDRFKRRAVMGVVGLVVAAGSWLIGAAVLPRWWAQRLGDVVDGRLTVGSFLGVAFGVVFTVLPLVAIWSGWRFRKSWRRAAGTLALAVVLAAPNLLTLGIVIGDGNAAHAGERILDVDGPGLRGGTLVGVFLGVITTLFVAFLAKSRARNKRKLRELRTERKEERKESRETATDAADE